MYDISDEIISQHWDVFRSVYHELLDLTSSSSFSQRYIYTNSTREMEVPVENEEPVSDTGFFCFCRYRPGFGYRSNDENEIHYYRKYFVTDEYNMNATSDSMSNYVAGRFVLEDHPMELIAIAEQPATVVSFPGGNIKNIEQFFVVLRLSLIHISEPTRPY